MYHLIFVVKIKNNMRVCILGNGLSSLTLAKSLVNQKIYVDVLYPKKKSLVINDEYEFHCVTPVAFDFRCTIQIWGESYTQPQTRVVK